MTARQPDVPNLICVAIGLSRMAIRGLVFVLAKIPARLTGIAKGRFYMTDKLLVLTTAGSEAEAQEDCAALGGTPAGRMRATLFRRFSRFTGGRARWKLLKSFCL